MKTKFVISTILAFNLMGMDQLPDITEFKGVSDQELRFDWKSDTGNEINFNLNQNLEMNNEEKADEANIKDIVNILIGPEHDSLSDFKKVEELSSFFIKNEVLQIELKLDHTTHILASNTHRYGGGNERKHGQSINKFATEISYVAKDGKFKGATLYFHYISKEGLLDYNETPRQNFHNQHFYRADGYLNDVELFSGISFKWKVTKNGKIQVNLGGVREGISPLGKTTYYLAGPAAYEHSKRIDTGIQFKYWLGDIDRPTLYTSLSVIDGDRIIGDTKLNFTYDSRANSYPGYIGKAVYYPTNHSKFFREYIGNVGFEGLINAIDIGSFPGQKRRSNDLAMALNYSRKIKGATFKFRAGKVTSERNQKGDGQGNHTPAVVTNSEIIEAGITGVKFLRGKLDINYAKENLEREGGVDDGEYWDFNNTVSKIESESYVLRYHNPFGILKKAKNLSFSIDITAKTYKPDQDFPYGTKKEDHLAGFIGGTKATQNTVSFNFGF